MIFTGRLLASGDGISFWQEDESGAIYLHLVSRGIVIRLSADELNALSETSAAALAASRETEARPDRARRLQILQARVNDYLRRERAAGDEGGESVTPTPT